MNVDALMLASVAWLGTYLIHSTLFLGLAWVLTRHRMLRAPRLTERIWRLALFGGLLTASVQMVEGTRPAWATWVLEADATSASVATLAAGDALHEAAPGPVATRPRPWQQPLGAPPLEGESQLASLAGALQESWRAFSAQAPTPSTAPTRLQRTRPHSVLGSQASPAKQQVRRQDTDQPEVVVQRASPLQAEASQSAHPELKTVGRLVPDASTGNQSSTLPWKNLLLASWILVGGLGLLGFLWACSCLLARMSKRSRIQSGPLLDQLEELRLKAGMGREVKLFVSATLEGPISYGWWRPRICLPVRALSDLTPAQQRSMLAHELAHVMRSDPLWFSLYTLMVRVFCFQPLNRLARRDLLEGAELLCDDWAVRWTGQRLGLASCLTEIADWILGEPRRALISAGMTDQPSRLGVRVERLLDDRRSPQPEPRHAWWSPAALGLLILAIGAAPGFSSTPAASLASGTALASPSAPGSPSSLEPSAPTTSFQWPVVKREPLGAPPRAPRSAPRSAPGPVSPSSALSSSMALEFELERSLLEDELDFLQLELDSLRLEVEGTKRSDGIQATLDQTAARLQKLRQYQERLERLLELVQPSSTNPR